jgi:hypothetical protein
MGPDNVFSDVDQFNFVSSAWSVKNPYSEAVADPDGFAAGNSKGYMTGGKNNDWMETLASVNNYCKEYNLDGDTWLSRKEFSGGRFHHAVFEVDGYGYISGGWFLDSKFGGNDTPAIWYGEDSFITKNCQKYDHLADAWINKQVQHNFTIGHYGIKNGFGLGYKTNPPLNVQKYDPITNSWSASKDSRDDLGEDIPSDGCGFSA